MKNSLHILKVFFCVIFICLAPSVVKSQSKSEIAHKTDSLRKILPTLSSLEERKNILLQMLELNYYNNTKLTINLCQILVERPEIKQDPMYYTRIAIIYGIALNTEGKFDKSIAVMKDAVNVAKEFKSKEGKQLYLKLVQNIAANFSELGYFNLHIQQSIEHLPLLNEVGTPFDEYSNYFNLALSFSWLQDYQKALTYLHMAQKAYERDQYRERYAGIIDITFASVFSMLEERDSVIKYVERAKSVIHADVREDLHTEFNSLYALSEIYKKNYTKALDLLDSEIERVSKANREDLLYVPLLYKAIYYQEINNNSEAIAVLNELLSKDDKYNDAIYKESILLRLACLYDAEKLYPLAVETYKSLIEYKRIAKEVRDLNNLEEWDYNFRFKDKLMEIDRLKIDREKVLLKSQRNQLLVIVLVASLIAIMILGYFIIVSKDRKKELKEKELQLLQASLAEREQKLQIHQMQLMNKVEERERNRIGTDLHDSIGGLLSAIKIAIYNMTNKELSVNDIALEGQKALRYINESKQELNRIVYNLTPMAVERFGLSEAIVQYCNSLQTEKLRIDLQLLDGLCPIDKGHEITIYRIIQEMVHNVIKHAEATRILLQLQSNQEGWVMISVEDNGKGMDLNFVKYKHGLGMKSLYARVEQLGGSINIKSKPNDGTSIYVLFRVSA